MTDRESIAATFKDPEFDQILVCCHRSPDGDACGSAHALSYALRQMGKQARVFCPDSFGNEFSDLTRAEEALPPFTPRHFVTVDVAAPEMLSDAPFASQIEIVIDHHRVNTVSAPLKWVCADASSCGELVLELILLWEHPLDAYLAKALYTAIATDTGCFRYSNTNEKTFLAAATLSRFAEEGEFYRINKRLFETKSRKRLVLEAYAIENAVFFADGKGAYLSVSLETQRRLGATYSDLEVLINVIRQIEGVLVSFVAKEREEGVFKVSVRSEKGFDASDFCQHFGGGGHLAAAGCTLLAAEEEAVSLLVQEVQRRLS